MTLRSDTGTYRGRNEQELDGPGVVVSLRRGLDRLHPRETVGAVLLYSLPDADAACRRGLARLGYRDLLAALADADRSLHIDPHEVWAYYRFRSSRPDGPTLRLAIADFAQALRADPDHLPALLSRGLALGTLGDGDRAAEDRDAVLAAEPCEGRDYWARGLARQQRGDLAGALADFDEALNRGFRNAAAYLARGRARQQRGDLEAALDDYDEAVYLDPDNAGTYHQRGLARHFQGDWEGARADYDTALCLQPASASVYNSRAGLRRAQGDPDGARADCDAAICLDPGNAAALANRARLRQACPDEALADCDHALRLDPRCAWAYCVRGSIQAHLAQPYDARAATADYQAALRLEPRTGELLRADDQAGGLDPDPQPVVLGVAGTGPPAALRLPPAPPGRCRAAVLGHAAAWLLAGVVCGVVAGLWSPIPVGSALEAGRWGAWLLGWALLGGLGAMFAGMAGMHALVRALGGYGCRNDPGSPALNVGPDAHLLLGVSLAAVWQKLGSGRRRGPRPLAYSSDGHWSTGYAPAEGQTDRLRRSLAAVALLAILHAGVNALSGSLGGAVAGLLLSGVCHSAGPVILVGSLVGLLAGVTIVAGPETRYRKTLPIVAIAGAAAGGLLAGVLHGTFPGLAAGALAGYYLAALLRNSAGAEDSDRPSLVALLGALAGGLAGAADFEAFQRLVTAIVGSALYWGPAAAAGGALTGAVSGLLAPGRVARGPLYERVFGGLGPAEPRGLRLHLSLFTGVAGLLIGGGVGLLGGGLFAILGAALAGRAGGAPRWILGGALAGGLLAHVYVVRIVGCRTLLAMDERLELVVPPPGRARLLIVLGAAVAGAAGGLLLGTRGATANGRLYWVLAGVVIGAVTGLKVRSTVVLPENAILAVPVGRSGSETLDGASRPGA